jgi:orotate phosphoribosyltransferase
VQQQLGLQVCAVAKLGDLMQYLQHHSVTGLADAHAQVQAYRARYGVEGV